MGQEEKKIVVAVIGPAGCGKSLLVQALSSSDGKACHSKHVDNADGQFVGWTPDGAACTIALADLTSAPARPEATGTQAEQHTRGECETRLEGDGWMRAAALARADVVCFVYSNREVSKYTLAEEWFPEMMSCTKGKKPIVVVSTKEDIPKPRVKYKYGQMHRNLARTLAELQRMARRPTVLCSATEGTGIQELRGALVVAYFAGPPPDGAPAGWCHLL